MFVVFVTVLRKRANWNSSPEKTVFVSLFAQDDRSAIWKQQITRFNNSSVYFEKHLVALVIVIINIAAIVIVAVALCNSCRCHCCCRSFWEVFVAEDRCYCRSCYCCHVIVAAISFVFFFLCRSFRLAVAFIVIIAVGTPILFLGSPYLLLNKRI